MGRHPGHPTPWTLLSDAAIDFAQAETEDEFMRASYRLRYAARFYRDHPGPNGHPDEAAEAIRRVMGRK